jgi:hypothetical protein
MVSSRLIRRIAVGVCACGIAGMIVSSVLNHNGAAITFGLVTAAAVLCSMVATAVAADVTRQLTASGGGLLAPVAAGLQGGGVAEETQSGGPEAVGAGRDPADEEQAALVESLVVGLVQRGADETEVRELVRQSVRLGRILPSRS